MPVKRVVCANVACKTSSRRRDLQQEPAGFGGDSGSNKEGSLGTGVSIRLLSQGSANTVQNVQCKITVDSVGDSVGEYNNDGYKGCHLLDEACAAAR